MDTCWSVPLLAALCMLLITLPATFMPLLFVHFIEDYNMSRQSAAWPENVLTMSTHLAGLLVGALQQRFNVANIAIFGCCLASAALIASAFQMSVVGLSLTLGVTYGLGLGSFITSVSVYNLMLFDKYKATAVSFTYIAWALASFFSPKVLSGLREAYAPNVTFLMTGAILLHTLPLSLLLRTPSPAGITYLKNCFRKFSTSTLNGTFKSSKRHAVSIEELSVATLSCPKFGTNGKESADAANQAAFSLKEDFQTMKEAMQETRNPQMALEDRNSGQARHTFTASVAVLLEPAFYVFMVAAVVGDYSLVAMLTTIVDFAVGHGVELDEAQYLVSLSAVGALLGRVVIMPFSDVVPSTRCPLFTGAVALSGLCILLLTYATSYGHVVALCIILSTADGFTSSIRGLLIAQYLGIERMATCTGLYGLLMIPVSLGSPLILGFFRDNTGSYNGFFLMLSLANWITAIILVLFIIFGPFCGKPSAQQRHCQPSSQLQSEATKPQENTSNLV